VQVIFIPPVHFSNFSVQRGTIIMFIPVGIPIEVAMPGAMPAVPIPVMLPRSTITVAILSLLERLPNLGTPSPRNEGSDLYNST
jgi:hypothetical protein